VAERVTERWRGLPPLVADAFLAAVVGAVTVISVVVNDHQDEGLTLSHFGVVLLVIDVVPLVWRRRAPIVVFALSGGAAAWYGIRPEPDPALYFAPLLALYTVAAYRPRRVSVPIIASVLVGSLFAFLLADSPDAADIAVGYVAWSSAWVIGDTMRTQRERTAWMAARRVDDARRVAIAERLAIARDLHDIVAHHVSVIAVQAEAARSVIAQQPERAGHAMDDVAETARAAMVELRRLLGVLRSEDTLAPQPGLEAIDDLVDSVRRAGMEVTLTRVDAVGSVDAVSGLTAYRVVQEALTNVLKHAGPCRADVGLALADGALVVTVTDDGSGPAGESSGHGLVGMRERVAVVGGTLDAGAAPTGGFTVRARLPLPA
jgi:signal transduction histidine kinase